MYVDMLISMLVDLRLFDDLSRIKMINVVLHSPWKVVSIGVQNREGTLILRLCLLRALFHDVPFSAMNTAAAISREICWFCCTSLHNFDSNVPICHVFYLTLIKHHLFSLWYLAVKFSLPQILATMDFLHVFHSPLWLRRLLFGFQC